MAPSLLDCFLEALSKRVNGATLASLRPTDIRLRQKAGNRRKPGVPRRAR